MHTVFFIDGGAGRVACATPALEKYVVDHPEEKISIFVYGWDSLLWSNKILQPLTINSVDKGLLDRIKDADKVISPEPYRLPEYFNQKVSLVEAFDILINGKCNGLSIPSLSVSKTEIRNVKKLIQECKERFGKEKTIVIQPFGSSAKFENIGGDDEVYDDSARSMNLLMYSKMVKELSNKYNIILFADKQFQFEEDQVTYKVNGDLRTYTAIISQCDYFIGCDSVGQHIARSFNIPGTIVFGSTFPENVSYPDWFQIIDKNKETRVYSPLRICDVDCHLADRMNSDCMDYSENEIENIIALIEQHINK